MDYENVQDLTWVDHSHHRYHHPIPSVVKTKAYGQEITPGGRDKNSFTYPTKSLVQVQVPIVPATHRLKQIVA